ncbi:hypothetical protein KIL84_000133 [Mauremys mutica]|uniref:Uncharacterized protein n=1 Tax=Mauremys mutica TaxID=74926 RepID=A0A9D3XFP8_9SAUR|nr:hypothetical protein KIL84_000133 [Mauremys mutica]
MQIFTSITRVRLYYPLSPMVNDSHTYIALETVLDPNTPVLWETLTLEQKFVVPVVITVGDTEDDLLKCAPAKHEISYCPDPGIPVGLALLYHSQSKLYGSSTSPLLQMSLRSVVMPEIPVCKYLH